MGTVTSIVISKHIRCRLKDQMRSSYIKNVNPRIGLIACGLVSVIGWLIILLSTFTTLNLIFPGLFMVGLACGLANPLASIYISEIAGSGNKGMVSSMFNFNYTFGVLFSNLIGALTG